MRVPSEMQKRLLDGDVDLVVLDGGRSPDALGQLVEHAASSGADLRLLVLVEPEGSAGAPTAGSRAERLPRPRRVVGGAAVRVRSLLWPGEEVTRQELIRVDDLTLNLATYQATCTASRSTSRISSTRCSRSW